jgi:glycosyltransferase involved in cell wall biosynthesis
VNILFLNSARRWGGNEKWVYLTAQVLAENNRVFFAYRSRVVGERFDVSKYKLPFFNELDLYTFIRLFIIAITKKIDIFISTKPKDYVIAGIIAKFLRKKNFIRLGIVRDLKNSFAKEIIYNKLNHGIIVNAPQIKDTLIATSKIKPEKIKVVYNGLNTQELDALARKRAGDKPFTFMIVVLGELSERKRVDNIIEGFARFLKRSRVEDGGLVIIGSGEKASDLKKLAKALQVNDSVAFLGFQENPYPYLRMGDVYLSASVNEGISNAMIEAMYFENAVICTEAGGTGQIIENGKNGFLIGNKNVEDEISGHLTALYKDKKMRKSFASAGHRTVIENFSLTRMADEIMHFCGMK